MRTKISRVASGALAVGVAAWLAVASMLPATTGCAGCDPAAECAARNGVTEASVQQGGENRRICERDATIGSMYAGVDLQEVLRDAQWAEYDENDVQQWRCFCKIVGGVLGECAFTAGPAGK